LDDLTHDDAIIGRLGEIVAAVISRGLKGQSGPEAELLSRLINERRANIHLEIVVGDGDALGVVATLRPRDPAVDFPPIELFSVAV